MTNADHTPIFDSIIMVTDRIVLNRNMADDVVNFQTVAGTVKDIRRGSKIWQQHSTKEIESLFQQCRNSRLH